MLTFINTVLLEAKLENISQILKIHQDYYQKFDSNNFLVGSLNEDKLKATILTNSKKLLILKKNLEDEVLGYAIIRHDIKNDIKDGEMTWFSTKVENKFENFPCYYIDQVAIRKEKLYQGYGKQLYQHIFEKFNDRKYFISFVVQKPYENRVSLKFHLSLNFKKIGYFQSECMFGLENYQSCCFLKCTYSQ